MVFAQQFPYLSVNTSGNRDTRRSYSEDEADGRQNCEGRRMRQYFGQGFGRGGNVEKHVECAVTIKRKLCALRIAVALDTTVLGSDATPAWASPGDESFIEHDRAGQMASCTASKFCSLGLDILHGIKQAAAEDVPPKLRFVSIQREIRILDRYGDIEYAILLIIGS
ncbi:hypothetical protein FDECE_17963 [Fusarium decemcellulare]|nr:hypothetical protein FDECE_17963 [Fusarium decemcellulare]